MAEAKLDLFEQLKRRKTVITKKPTVAELFFCLNFDSVGAYLTVVDKAGEEIEVEIKCKIK